MYMLYIQCYVRMVLCACCTIGNMYIWCCVHDCTSGVAYMLYIWCCVKVVMCTCCAYGVVYMWCRVHVVHVVLGTSDIVYTLYKWYDVHVELCTHPKTHCLERATFLLVSYPCLSQHVAYHTAFILLMYPSI